MGIAPSSHNTGVSLVSASARDGLRIVCNNEEERFSGIKHDGNYPHLSLAQLEPFLRDHALQFNDIDAIVTTWDYSEALVTGLHCAFDEFPRGLALLGASASPKFNFSHSLQAFRAPARLAEHSGAKAPRAPDRPSASRQPRRVRLCGVSLPSRTLPSR